MELPGLVQLNCNHRTGVLGKHAEILSPFPSVLARCHAYCWPLMLHMLHVVSLSLGQRRFPSTTISLEAENQSLSMALPMRFLNRSRIPKCYHNSLRGCVGWWIWESGDLVLFSALPAISVWASRFVSLCHCFSLY